jgi:hypothetical protein
LAGLIDDIIYIMTSEGTRRSRGMLIWNPRLDAVKFSFDVQNVIALRLLKIAAEGAASSAERTRMVTENVKAEAVTQAADAVALAQGKSIAQAADAVALAHGKSSAQAADAVAPAQGKSIAQAADAVAPAQGKSIAQAASVAPAQGKSIKTATKLAMAPIKRRARANHHRLKGK